ncbi:STAS domain-containing protein [Sphingobacterium sp. DK4209]|uniref:STAS domain-containing protein n=1 Tax=Sphingobacterium zhuxiongii TaxID=2662364 RepID=A0A5Q0QC87_9SPHI|nr:MULTISPECIES: STAS domain-containing protein [unclassified Sphingobacterium]MVZ64835.1 STAS domain-containing protein [Sphingobacterium sp. DK4209]QGA25182.1 STAS domain-containing protein [Sphingobacterium sp. dk4302]
MKFTVDKHERYVVIEPLQEKLDGDAAANLKGEFMLRNTGGQRNIVLDMNQVQDTDEAGIRTGLLARRLCKSSGGLFILTNLNDGVKDFIKSLGLDKYFIITTNVEKAKDLIFGNEIRLDLKQEQN